MAIFIVTLTACSSKPEPILRVGTNQWPGYESLYLARDLGLLENTNIKLKELTSASEVMNAFRQQQLDVAALTLDEVLMLSQSEHDLRVFVVMDISNGADKVIASKQIQSLDDLQGRRLGVEKTALGAFMLQQLLQQADLRRDQITVIPATIDQHQYLMTSNQCDAVVTFDPVASKLQAAGYHAIFDSSQIPGKIVDVLVTRQSILDTQAHNIHTLLSSHWKALDYIQSHPQEAYRRMAPRLDINADELEQSFNELLLPDRQHNQDLLDHTLTQTVQQLSDTMVKAGIINLHPDAKTLLVNRHLPAS